MIGGAGVSPRQELWRRRVDTANRFSVYPLLLMALVVAMGCPNLMGIANDFAIIEKLFALRRH